MHVSNAEFMRVDSSEGFYVHTCIGAHFLAAIAPVHVTGSVEVSQGHVSY